MMGSHRMNWSKKYLAFCDKELSLIITGQDRSGYLINENFYG